MRSWLLWIGSTSAGGRTAAESSVVVIRLGSSATLCNRHRQGRDMRSWLPPIGSTSVGGRAAAESSIVVIRLGSSAARTPGGNAPHRATLIEA
jgi:hypothetical protein